MLSALYCKTYSHLLYEVCPINKKRKMEIDETTQKQMNIQFLVTLEKNPKKL